MIQFYSLIKKQKSLENQKKTPICDKYLLPLTILINFQLQYLMEVAKVATTNDLDSFEQYAIKNERKTEKLQTFDLSY